MKKLSTGQDSTLGNYKELATLCGFPQKALDFLDQKIAESPHGADEEVIADEGQMINVLASLK